MHMTNLEERLGGPDGEAVRAASLKSLMDAEARIRAKLSSPLLDRDAFAKASLLADALRCAQGVLLQSAAGH